MGLLGHFRVCISGRQQVKSVMTGPFPALSGWRQNQPSIVAHPMSPAAAFLDDTPTSALSNVHLPGRGGPQTTHPRPPLPLLMLGMDGF